LYISITAAQPRRFIFPFRSRTIRTDRVHVADEDVWMFVVVHNGVISKRNKPQICRNYTRSEAANLFFWYASLCSVSSGFSLALEAAAKFLWYASLAPVSC
jgi:hypothetical protein